MFVDVHTHLADPIFEKDLGEVIDSAKKIGLVNIISNGVSIETNRLTLEISKKFDIVKPALGLHPFLIKDLSLEEIEKEIEFIKKNSPIAIGEVGLDFSQGIDEKKQKAVFEKFLGLAEKLKVPTIIHSRKAEKDVFEILQTTKLKKVIMHCFTGKLNLAKKLEDAGFSFSIPPIINHATQFQRLVEEIRLTSVLSESDAPVLSPEKGKRNEPKSVKIVVEKIAEIKKITFEEAQKIVFINFKKMFMK
ncbi:TatD family hydrolase [Candidatus Woesearchaeota archaeon]|nr:TatD family hydrolase [Candidatus Woesearchaeota archaeon]